MPAGRPKFNPKQVLVIGVTFGSFLVLESLGAPGFAKMLAIMTGALFVLNTGYAEAAAQTFNRLSNYLTGD